MMDIDVEAEAQAILKENGIDPFAKPWMKLLAACVLRKSANVRVVPNLPVVSRWLADADVIEVRAGLQRGMEDFGIAHEIGERRLHALRYRGPDPEAVANGIGAGLLLPRQYVQRVVRDLGRNVAEVAEAMDVDQAMALLRIGEVFGTPLALVSPQQVRVRGEEREWGPESNVRSIAAGRVVVPGVERTLLTDRPRYVGLTIVR